MKTAVEPAVAVVPMPVVNMRPHQESAGSASGPRIQCRRTTPPPTPPARLDLLRLRLVKRLSGLFCGQAPSIPFVPDLLCTSVRAFPSSLEQLIRKPTEHISTSFGSSSEIAFGGYAYLLPLELGGDGGSVNSSPAASAARRRLFHSSHLRCSSARPLARSRLKDRSEIIVNSILVASVGKCFPLPPEISVPPCLLRQLSERHSPLPRRKPSQPHASIPVPASIISGC